MRVVATLADGRRLVANRRTQGLDINETVEVAAVQVPVIVTDAKGRFVRGLEKPPFTLIENGKPQRIDTLIDESLPLELIATIDISASMERAMPQVQAAVKGLLARLRPGDTTTLLGFNESVFVLAEREGDAALRAAAVDALVPWGGTAFYDATVRSLELVSEKAGRRGIIIFSDGDDRHSVGRRDDSLRRIEEGQVVSTRWGSARPPRPSSARRCGRSPRPAAAAPTSRAGPRISTPTSVLSWTSCRTSTSCPTSPSAPPDGSWRTLEIRACEGCQVRAREGYRAPER